MTATALDVLRALRAHNREAGLAPPAALIGQWWDADAVIAPSIELRADYPPPDDPAAFWFGYLGFPLRATESDLPETVGGVTDEILILRDGRWIYQHVDGIDCAPWLRDIIDEPVHHSDRAWSAAWQEPERAPHIAAIDACLDAIRAGEVYQACVCTQFTGTVTGEPVDFFATVAGATRPAKSAFLQGDWGSVASFSPETFLRRRGRTVWSSPIKGTVAATADPADLRASTKDVAENVMIVDLVRNDLGRVAMTGTVTVPELLTVVAAPGVWHLVSTVQAQVTPETGTDDLLRATFPPASVTGTPKVRALELLSTWESAPRGVYCGAIGMTGPGRELDLNVAIRTVTITPDGTATLGVGGGITIDSDPAREWQECLDKAASIVGIR